MLEEFSFVVTIAELSRIFATFYAGFPENRFLDDMCCVKLSLKLNCPFANTIAELFANATIHMRCPLLYKPRTRTFSIYVWIRNKEQLGLNKLGHPVLLPGLCRK